MRSASIDTLLGTCYFFPALTGEVTELAEGGTLLRCCTGNRAGGSNPPLSAIWACS